MVERKKLDIIVFSTLFYFDSTRSIINGILLLNTSMVSDFDRNWEISLIMSSLFLMLMLSPVLEAVIFPNVFALIV